MTDFRELCRELLQIDDEQPSDYADWMRRWKAAIFRARAALAQPDGPTLQLPEQAPDEHPPSNLDRREVAAWYHGHASGWQAARATLAQPEPAPAAEGEVGELVKTLRELAYPVIVGSGCAVKLRRAADLLEQQATAYVICERERLHQSTRAADLEIERHPVPVPVSERLPGPEDCDAEGRCWFHLPDMGTEPLWRLTDPSMRTRYHSHWLPAHALPLPQGEVE